MKKYLSNEQGKEYIKHYVISLLGLAAVFMEIVLSSIKKGLKCSSEGTVKYSPPLVQKQTGKKLSNTISNQLFPFSKTLTNQVEPITNLRKCPVWAGLLPTEWSRPGWVLGILTGPFWHRWRGTSGFLLFQGTPSHPWLLCLSPLVQQKKRTEFLQVICYQCTSIHCRGCICTQLAT